MLYRVAHWMCRICLGLISWARWRMSTVASYPGFSFWILSCRFPIFLLWDKIQNGKPSPGYVNCTVNLHSTAVSHVVAHICTLPTYVYSCILTHQYTSVPYPPMSTLAASSMCQWHNLWPALDVSGSCKLASIGVEARKVSLVSRWIFPWLCSDNTGVSVDGSSPWVTELGTMLGTVSPPDLRVRVWPSSAAFLYRLNI